MLCTIATSEANSENNSVDNIGTLIVVVVNTLNVWEKNFCCFSHRLSLLTRRTGNNLEGDCAGGCSVVFLFLFPQ